MTLSGHSLYCDPNITPGDDDNQMDADAIFDLEGNNRRNLWRRCCHAFSKSVSVKDCTVT
jgi:hypothetical protein